MQFDGAQQFATAFEHKRRVRSGKFHQDLRPLPIALFGDGRVDGDAIFQAQCRR